MTRRTREQTAILAKCLLAIKAKCDACEREQVIEVKRGEGGVRYESNDELIIGTAEAYFTVKEVDREPLLLCFSCSQDLDPNALKLMATKTRRRREQAEGVTDRYGASPGEQR